MLHLKKNAISSGQKGPQLRAPQEPAQETNGLEGEQTLAGTEDTTFPNDLWARRDGVRVPLFRAESAGRALLPTGPRAQAAAFPPQEEMPQDREDNRKVLAASRIPDQRLPSCPPPCPAPNLRWIAAPQPLRPDLRTDPLPPLSRILPSLHLPPQGRLNPAGILNAECSERRKAKTRDADHATLT